MTPKKCAESFGIGVTNAIKNSAGVKFNMSHFKSKKLEIDEIDVDSLQNPIRSSTPTPSIDSSTIIASHLDYSGIGDDLVCDDEPTDKQEDHDKDEILQSYIDAANKKVRSTPVMKQASQESDNYIKDWMKKEDGVCEDNTDVAPSLYALSVTLSDSLLDVTSVSRNIPKPIPKTYQKQGRALNTSRDYSNTKFM